MNPERPISRRSALLFGTLVPAVAVASTMIPEGLVVQEKDLSEYQAGVIAHNACVNLTKFSNALGTQIPHIEVDLSSVHGRLIVGHSENEYLSMPIAQRDQQALDVVFNKVYEAGKHPFLDLKDNTKGKEIYSRLPEYVRHDHLAMASSNNHNDLERLKKEGFPGIILFSLGDAKRVTDFLDISSGKTFAEGEYGVSIKHELLSPFYASIFKKLGLLIASWNPKTESDIKRSLKSKADFITSDEFKILEKIGKPAEILVTSEEPQSPPQG